MATAIAALKSLRFRAEAPAGLIVQRRLKLKPANRMRTLGGGAFPLPSMDGVPLPNASRTLTPSTAC